jgi:hypothetical protein
MKRALRILATSSKILRICAKLLFPVWIWRLCGILPWVVFRIDLRRSRMSAVGAATAHLLMFAVVGVPLCLLLASEMLIFANHFLDVAGRDETAVSDFESLERADVLPLPGPGGAALRAPTPGDREDFERYLVELYSPVVIHRVANHPEWDAPVRLDFDVNWDPRDNVQHLPQRMPLQAFVYGELTAETTDSYYFTYTLYHTRDYDHPLREKLIRFSHHDNDHEGLHLRVDKNTGIVAEAETTYHNRFLLFNRTGTSAGSEPVHGRLNFEDDTHVVIFVQSQGHGIRCAQIADQAVLDNDTKVLRVRGLRAAVAWKPDRTAQSDVTYDLANFSGWYQRASFAQAQADAEAWMFDGVLVLGTDLAAPETQVGRYIAGFDGAHNGFSRPKPPWSWDDEWDDLPVGAWFILPGRSFAVHSGAQVSQVYLHNRAWHALFEAPRGNSERAAALLGSESSVHASSQVYAMQRAPVAGVVILLKEYLNYVFRALG